MEQHDRRTFADGSVDDFRITALDSLPRNRCHAEIIVVLHSRARVNS